MRLFLILILFFIPLKNINALENKIIVKIENEIISSLDLKMKKIT